MATITRHDVYPGMSYDELDLLTSTILPNAIHQAREDYKICAEMAHRLRHDTDYDHPLFAPGENGAVAAERIGARHRETELRLEALLDRLLGDEED